LAHFLPFAVENHLVYHHGLPRPRQQVRFLFALIGAVNMGNAAEETPIRVVNAIANAMVGAFDLEETKTFLFASRPEIIVLWFIGLFFPILLALIALFIKIFFVKEVLPLPSTEWEGMQVGLMERKRLKKVKRRPAIDPYHEPRGYYGLSKLGGADHLGYTESLGGQPAYRPFHSSIFKTEGQPESDEP
jgi:hypothetical protein